MMAVSIVEATIYDVTRLDSLPSELLGVMSESAYATAKKFPVYPAPELRREACRDAVLRTAMRLNGADLLPIFLHLTRHCEDVSQRLSALSDFFDLMLFGPHGLVFEPPAANEARALAYRQMMIPLSGILQANQELVRSKLILVKDVLLTDLHAMVHEHAGSTVTEVRVIHSVVHLPFSAEHQVRLVYWPMIHRPDALLERAGVMYGFHMAQQWYSRPHGLAAPYTVTFQAGLSQAELMGFVVQNEQDKLVLEGLLAKTLLGRLPIHMWCARVESNH